MSYNSSGSYFGIGDETDKVPTTNILTRSREHCCYGNATLSICVFAYKLGANDIKPLIVAMEIQERVSFALLSSYKIFCIAINTLKVLTSSCKVPDIVV